MRIDKADVPKIEHVLKTMYPHCRAKNFKELLKQEKEQAKKRQRAKVQQKKMAGR